MALLPENRYEKLRYPIAVVLSTAVVLVWYLFFLPPPREKVTPAPAPSDAPATAEEQIITEQTDITLDTESLSDSSDALAPQQSAPPAPLASSPPPSAETIVLENRYLKLKFSPVNATIVEAMVANGTQGVAAQYYSEDLEAGSLPGFYTGRLLFSSGFTNLDSSVPAITYQVVAATASEVTFATQLRGASGLVTVRKTYTLGDLYSVQLDVAFLDENNQPVRVPYYVLNGSNLGGDVNFSTPFDIKRLSYDVGSDNHDILKGSFFGSDKAYEEVNGNVDWIALDNRFYARVLLPANKETIEKTVFAKRAYINTQGKEDFYFSAAFKVLGNGTDAFEYYFIPKNRAILNNYYEEKGYYFFNLFHQFSFMRILSSVMYWFLEQINNLFNNYGWSILAMTIIIKLATFPLSHKGMKSMQKMQMLSPKIEAIKTQYKSNPQKMNVEMMTLYKKERVSPLGGCLPMLVPIPIFIALYSLFQNMVELREVPFYWIKDLSLPDTIYTLSYSIPLLGPHINLLPIVMTITALGQALLPMSPQQKKAKLSSAPASAAESMQKQMNILKYVFPIMFFFICWNLPSALVFFWTVQNVFSLLQILYTRKAINFARG